MKKKSLANVIMILVIVLIVAGGILATGFFQEQEESIYGGEYKITPIANDRLVENEDTENVCTITIRCDTIFDNAEALEEAKVPYVPEDGEILPITMVEFTPGETVFEVLQRVCEVSDLQIEYSWTPLYDSYYIEGINHLYEFDCGIESGWMYKVNEIFPNYGCSDYEVQPGDEIVWCYTCVGLGADVGDSWMEEE